MWLYAESAKRTDMRTYLGAFGTGFATRCRCGSVSVSPPRQGARCDYASVSCTDPASPSQVRSLTAEASRDDRRTRGGKKERQSHRVPVVPQQRPQNHLHVSLRVGRSGKCPMWPVCACERAAIDGNCCLNMPEGTVPTNQPRILLESVFRFGLGEIDARIDN